MPNDTSKEAQRPAADADPGAWADYAWEVGKARLFDARTNLFYEFITSYDPAHRFDHLPSVDEISRCYPNPNGRTTGMEDSTINGGVMLAALCDRYAATRAPHVKHEAEQIYKGLKLCGTLSRAPGLVLRSVSPLDSKSYYIETSRDQLTHFAHGLWRYFRSPLADDAQRSEMSEMLVNLSRRLESNIVPANDYRFLRENGEHGVPDKMWHVKPHESSRLPMIYAVTWAMTSDDHWRELYEAYAWPAAEHAAELDLTKVPQRPCYGLFQHQCAMEALLHIEEQDADLKGRWCAEMNRVAECMPAYSRKIHDYRSFDVNDVHMDFRTRPNQKKWEGTGYGHEPANPEELSYCSLPLRELGESVLITVTAPDVGVSDEQRELLVRGLRDVDYDRVFTCGVLYPQAAYWACAAAHA